MAVSNSHRFGQLIGDLLEVALEPQLREFANKHGLFLDRKGERTTRKGKKLTWIDIKENAHDLDFVLERDGTDSELGSPVAFIEIAWRRYTKHSKNKAQEIQGAILPLLEKYAHVSPYAGVVLAGEFTSNSLTQLKSQGFAVLYFSYESMVAAFRKYGIDAAFGEETSEEEFKEKLEATEKLKDIKIVAEELVSINKEQVIEFFTRLEGAVTRKIESIIIWPLHGSGSSVKDIAEALAFLNSYKEADTMLPFVKYEIIIKYNTGTVINATCITKKEAIEFLERNGGK